jgi:hypothetical protein
MRTLKPLPLLVALGVLAVPAIAAAHQDRRRCAVPAHWSVVARDRYAVVARVPSGTLRDSTYDYCSRTASRWIQMTAAPNGEVIALRLVGRYAAFETWSGDSMPIFLWNVTTGDHDYVNPGYTYDAAFYSPPTRPLSPFRPLSSDPDFRLAANGVVARIDAFSGVKDAPPTGSVIALTLVSSVVLGSSTNPSSELDDLQLFSCAAGCRSNTVIVAWTDDGQPRYAQVSAPGRG